MHYLAQIAAAAHKWHVEGALVDVALHVGDAQYLALVDTVDAKRLIRVSSYNSAQAI